jgi:hypothetical protein
LPVGPALAGLEMEKSENVAYVPGDKLKLRIHCEGKFEIVTEFSKTLFKPYDSISWEG